MNAVYSLESMPLKMQREIVNLVTRLSIKTSLLDKEDIKLITGYSIRFIETKMLTDPHFPAPYRIEKSGQKKWKNAEVMAYINSKREDW